MSDDVLVRVEGVSKKFCRSLKRSLWYGIQDISRDLNPFGKEQRPLEPGGAGGQLRSGEFWAVNDVSFELRRGECLGLIGHNGAGKTTLLKMLNGLIKPDHGRIEMRGRVGALIALGAGFNPILTGRENIYVNGSVLGLTKREIDSRIDEIIDFAEIGDFIDSPVQSYSSGMQVRLGFAVATALEPAVLILDEVLAVGDVRFQAKCLSRIAEIRACGAGLIFVSHSSHQLLMVCDRGILLEGGRMVSVGPIGNVLSQYAELPKKSHDGATIARESWNAPQVEVKDVLFRKLSDLTATDRFSVGQPIEMQISVENKLSTELAVVVDVRIIDSIGTLFQGTSEFGSNFVSLPPGRCMLCVVFTAGFVRHGDSLRINFALWGHKTKSILCWARGHEIHINAVAGTTGRDSYPVQFEVRTP